MNAFQVQWHREIITDFANIPDDDSLQKVIQPETIL